MKESGCTPAVISSWTRKFNLHIIKYDSFNFLIMTNLEFQRQLPDFPGAVGTLLSTLEVWVLMASLSQPVVSR